MRINIPSVTYTESRCTMQMKSPVVISVGFCRLGFRLFFSLTWDTNHIFVLGFSVGFVVVDWLVWFVLSFHRVFFCFSRNKVHG